MLEALEKLLILQDRDRKLYRVKNELSYLEPQRKAFQSKTQKSQADLEQAKLHLRQIETQRRDLELQVESKKQSIERYSLQQFQTKKNEEYRALAHEIDACKASISTIEDQQLELMEQAETVQKQVNEASTAAKQAQKLCDEELATMAKRESLLRKEIADLSSDRECLAEAVDPSLRARYERLLKQKGEKVVVGVEHGVCGGCHMGLPPQLVVTCQGQHEIVACPNCGRLLYYSSEMSLDVAE